MRRMKVPIRAIVVCSVGMLSVWHFTYAAEQPIETGNSALLSCPRDANGNSLGAWVLEPKAEASITEHHFAVGGESFNYRAAAGTLVIRDDSGKPVANMGYIAYTRNEPRGSTVRRPVMFAFNGGPGFSSVPMNMALLGPERVLVPDPGEIAPRPYEVVANAFSMLDKTDLVMIDPVGTGWSHAICGAKDKEFWSVDRDVQSISRFIVQYLSDHHRWTSPKYLIGESYGTIRAAALVDYLRAYDGLTFNGVILVSMATNIELIPMGAPRNELSYTFLLPSYAAVAWYHHLVVGNPPALVPFLEEVRRYAAGPFTAALLKGDKLSDEERDAVARQVHKYTGLSTEYLEMANLRVPVMAFAQELLKSRRETISRLDGRYVGLTSDLLQKSADYDPELAVLVPLWAATAQDYYRQDLRFGKGQEYRVWNLKAAYHWNMVHQPIAQPFARSAETQSTVNSGVDLAHALVDEPNLRVLVLSGYFDLASPFMVAQYMISHLGIPKQAAARVQIRYFKAGHMMYTHLPALKKIKGDLDTFVESTQ